MFKKGEKVIHATYGAGVYSHKYSADASIVIFDEACVNGFTTRVVVDKNLKKD